MNIQLTVLNVLTVLQILMFQNHSVFEFQSVLLVLRMLMKFMCSILHKLHVSMF